MSSFFAIRKSLNSLLPHPAPRLFKEAVRLNRQKDKIARLLSEITPLNAKKKSTEIETILTDYI